MEDATRLVSDAHAVMALGSLSSVLHSRAVERDAKARDGEKLSATDGIPEPPEWLELWVEALGRTRPDALRDLREKLGGREPTLSERLEVEAIAQAHYEAYTRLDAAARQRLGGFIAWEAMPDERRALMKATIADMIASGSIRVGPAAAHPKGSHDLYVVFAYREGTDTEPPEYVFVETEDAGGRGVGGSAGLQWDRHPKAGELWRLGPFPAMPDTLGLAQRVSNAIATALEQEPPMGEEAFADRCAELVSAVFESVPEPEPSA